MRQKVVIIGHSFSSRLSLIRSVAQIGCEVSVIVTTGFKRDGKTLNDKKPIDCYSKYVSHVYYCLRRDKDAFIQLLLDKCTVPNQKVILIPDSDDTVSAIDDHQEVLKDFFYFPHIIDRLGTISYWMDKSHQKEMARSVGLNVADARIVEVKNGVYSIPSDMKYPCYTKPLATMNGRKLGMRRCNDNKELASALDDFIIHWNQTGKILVEDYKEIAKEYALLGFSDGKDVIIPGIMHLLVISQQYKGIALQGRVTSISGFEDVVEKFRQLVKQIGFVGLFDIDFYESDGKLYFCELNLRFGGSGYAVTKMGVNLPAMYVQLWEEAAKEKPATIVEGSAIYVNERMCFADWDSGYISTRHFFQYLKTADIRFMPEKDDPMPEIVFKINCIKRWIVKTLKGVIDRKPT